MSFAEPAIKVALLRCIRVFTAVEKTKQSLAFPGIEWMGFGEWGDADTSILLGFSLVLRVVWGVNIVK